MNGDVKRWVSQGSPFEAEFGYARAVVDGAWVHVSGTTGFDYPTMSLPTDIVGQCRQALANIAAALAEADASCDDVVRVHYYVLDAGEFATCAPLLRTHFNVARPAATLLVVAGLIDPRLRIEIEVTAHIGDNIPPQHPS